MADDARPILDRLRGPVAAGALAALLVGYAALGWAMSRQSAPFPLTALGLGADAPVGARFTAMLEAMIRRELDGFGGWRPNDKFPPPFVFDNRPNFQLGAREGWLRAALVLRENMSRRARTTSPIDPHLNAAYGFLSVRPDAWLFPSYEGQLKRAIEELAAYRAALGRGEAGFYPRADVLVKLLEQFASLLGDVTNRLDGDDVGWLDQDDRFYFAKGVAYALLQSLRAARADFAKALRENDGDPLMDAILDELSRAYFEPLVVLAGDEASMWNNHLARVAQHLLAARQKMNSLASVLLHRGTPSQG